MMHTRFSPAGVAPRDTVNAPRYGVHFASWGLVPVESNGRSNARAEAQALGGIAAMVLGVLIALI